MGNVLKWPFYFPLISHLFRKWHWNLVSLQIHLVWPFSTHDLPSFFHFLFNFRDDYDQRIWLDLNSISLTIYFSFLEFTEKMIYRVNSIFFYHSLDHFHFTALKNHNLKPIETPFICFRKTKSKCIELKKETEKRERESNYSLLIMIVLWCLGLKLFVYSV